MIVSKIKTKLTPQLLRYSIMATTLVGLELLLFQMMVQVKVPYLVATGLSVVLGVILNWFYSHRFVFTNRPHPPHKEALLSVVAGTVGLIIQLVVVGLLVRFVHVLPFIGKLGAMIATFAWNYWFRKKYVFYDKDEAK